MYSPSRKRSDSTAGVINLNMESDTVPATLDELLSPAMKVADAFDEQQNVRDSAAELESLNDELRFSNVPLSGGGTNAILDSPSSPATSTSVLERRKTTSSGGLESNFVAKKTLHKKSASSYTVGSASRESAGNLPFLLQRLDLQKAQEGANLARRISLDGQQRIQEEFERIQSGHQANPMEMDAEHAIDWGEFVLSV